MYYIIPYDKQIIFTRVEHFSIVTDLVCLLMNDFLFFKEISKMVSLN